MNIRARCGCGWVRGRPRGTRCIEGSNLPDAFSASIRGNGDLFLLPTEGGGGEDQVMAMQQAQQEARGFGGLIEARGGQGPGSSLK